MTDEDVGPALEHLTSREQDLMRFRFGLDDGRSHTCEEVGDLFNVAPQRVRQIEAKARGVLRKLNRPEL